MSDWREDFLEDFDSEFDTSRKIIIAISSTIAAIVFLTILGLCAFGCCGSFFAIRQLREYRERNRRPQQNTPASTFHQSNPTFNPSAPYNH
ncbi:Oidioi.mRNA.OKI2018_I69.chr2.g4079.t1.cds [Oikopleura dioica]|uniref:Oidioi.mRNA.OKI2018_I69.chr2.g4079.t1.cds n=1 Tax=Oikopleura dioica TaxID=34765 RepID=A0ABN7SVV2_OIKDI|nr:Oidioi.mRNA.OKI2018_I69.chr2.g4079.t1.cds [Oikopleura dioica]